MFLDRYFPSLLLLYKILASILHTQHLQTIFRTATTNYRSAASTEWWTASTTSSLWLLLDIHWLLLLIVSLWWWWTLLVVTSLWWTLLIVIGLDSRRLLVSWVKVGAAEEKSKIGHIDCSWVIKVIVFPLFIVVQDRAGHL